MRGSAGRCATRGAGYEQGQDGSGYDLHFQFPEFLLYRKAKDRVSHDVGLRE